MIGYYAFCAYINIGFAAVNVGFHNYGFAVAGFGFFLWSLVMFQHELRKKEASK